MEMLNPFSLAGKRVLVTGASSGIGRQTAISCAQMGATVIGTGRDMTRLSETLQRLREFGDEHRVLNAELTESSDREALVAFLAGVPLHGVVHAAGISRLSPVRMFTEAHLRELQAINVEAPMLLTQALLKRKMIQDDGSLVFISSIAAHIGVPGVGVYSGTKAALVAMVRCLAMEVAKRRIRANCLSPSLVETPLFDLAVKASPASMEQQRSNHPLGFGNTEDVANATVFLLSGASRWITGTTIVMDGGLTLT